MTTKFKLKNDLYKRDHKNPLQLKLFVYLRSIMHSLALTSSSIPPQKLEYAALPPNTSIIGAITVL